jgi:hypothetical protein
MWALDGTAIRDRIKAYEQLLESWGGVPDVVALGRLAAGEMPACCHHDAGLVAS